LLQIEEGSIYLEDSHAVVELDMSHAKTFGGFFAEGMVIHRVYQKYEVSNVGKRGHPGM
jgi:hypothetical protein